MKKFIRLTALISVLLVNSSIVLSNNFNSLPSIYGAEQYPRAKRKYVKHKIQLEMNNSNISNIIIDIPQGLEIKNDITVHTLSGKQIDVDTSIVDDKINIAFNKLYQANEVLEIDLNSVNINKISNGWNYRVSVKLSDSNEEIPIGVASVRIYN